MFLMTDLILVPSADQVLIPTLQAMYAKRPSCFKHLNLKSGVYYHPVHGYRAQAARMLSRLTELAGARTLKTATGSELLDYARSEFDLDIETAKTKAEGTLTLSRTSVSPTPGGFYPKGTRVTRSAFVSLGIAFESAEFETLADAYVAAGANPAITEIPIRCTREGTAGNTPLLTQNATLGVTAPSLVGNMSVSGFATAGGSDGADDPFVRNFARSQARGQFGPTSEASKFGVLAASGVRHFLVFDSALEGKQTILIADASWASSGRWAGKVQQSMIDNDLVGFGCVIIVGQISSKVVTVTSTVVLRDGNDRNDTTEIDVAIQGAVASYFDDRPDFNTWTTESLKSAIVQSHTKIFRVVSAVVSDASDNTTLSEIPTADFSLPQYHYLVSNQAVKITYQGPS